MSSKDDGLLGDFFHVNKLVYRVCGIWLPGKNVSLPLRILYFSYVLVFYTLGFIFLICEFIIFRDMLRDISKFVTYIGMLFTHMVGIMKLSILTLCHTRIKQMMNNLQDTKYRYENYGDFQPDLLLFEGKKISSLTSILFVVLYNFVGISAHISSEITINEVEKNNTLDGNMTCLDFTPYYFYVPFPATTREYCEYLFFYMNIGLDIHATLIACHDGVFVALLNCLRTQLIIVGGAFRTIRQRCLKNLDLPENLFVLHEEENLEVEKKLYEELTHCTKHLNLLLQIRDDIEQCFSFVTLAQSLASLFILASCLYISSTVPITSPEFFSELEYFICILTQLSLICWFGNEITVASDQIALSIFEGDWYSASPRFKRSMILTMCRMQRPVYLSIGKFTPLTLTTLVAVCRGSFSYFAVLRSIQ